MHTPIDRVQQLGESKVIMQKECEYPVRCEWFLGVLAQRPSQKKENAKYFVREPALQLSISIGWVGYPSDDYRRKRLD